MRLQICGLLAGGLLPAAALAQTTTPPAPMPGRLLVTQGVALHDKGEYEQAAASYRQVLPGDSAYASAQSELALTLMSAEKYKESLEAAKIASKLEPFEPHTYATLANDYEGLKQMAEARQAYAAGLKLFPYSENLWINQGILELNQKQIAPALASLQRAIELRPGKASGHRLLGKAALLQGQLAHAMISMLVSLAIDPDGQHSRGVLVDLERVSIGMAVVEPADQLTPVAPNTAFEELDQLIAGKVALTASYTSKVKFKAGIVKQLQLLVEKFPVDADPATDFWVRAYAPLVRELRQGDNLTTFTYLILSSADEKSAAQWVKSNKGKVEQLATAVSGPLLSLRSRQPLAGAPAPVSAWFGEGGYLQGLGPGERDAQGQAQPSGDWVIVGRDGSVSERGAFDTNHKRTGKWQDFRPDGTVQLEATYAAGELEGPMRAFYPGGQLKSEATYRAGKAEGTSKSYAEDGHLTQTRQLVKGDYEGEAVDYYADKTVSFRVTMHADEKNGVMERFYPDGTLKQHEQYVGGKGQGEQVEYYPDKTLQRKSNFDKGEPHGLYTYYFANGKVQETGEYAHGKRTGVWKEYFSNGQLSVEKTYDAAGELHGPYHDYDYQGHHYGDSQYEHGRLVRSTSLDAQGKPRPGADYALKKSRTMMKSYDAEGRLSGEGAVENGQMSGEWKTYYSDGTLRDVLHYTGGTRQGVGESYYPNGQLHQRRSYNAKGEGEGTLEQFTADGQLLQTGSEIAGQDAGVWKTYFGDGKLSHERELHNDELSGSVRALTATGQVGGTKLYRYGVLKQVIDYDSTGRVVGQQEMTPAVRELVSYFPGIVPQQVMSRSAVVNGEYEGPITWLWPGGKPETTLTMRAGRRYGPYRRYYPSGQLEMENSYLNGQHYGPTTSYFPDGTPSIKGRYLAGEPVGEWTSYFPNGKVQQVQRYDDDGSLDGPTRIYNPAGELLAEYRYERGRLVGFAGPGATAEATAAPQALAPAGGPIETKFANSKPAVTSTYARNYPSGTTTYYYASGQVYRRATYVKGVLSGPVVCYWPSGKPMSEESYQHGERHGPCRYYRPDGSLEREQGYRQGERQGAWVYYDAQGKPQHRYTFWNDAVYNGQ